MMPWRCFCACWRKSKRRTSHRTRRSWTSLRASPKCTLACLATDTHWTSSIESAWSSSTGGSGPRARRTRGSFWVPRGDFLIELSADALDIDFQTVSLRDAIEHLRTKNWVAKAEAALSDGQFADVARWAAGGLAIYVEHCQEAEARHRHDPHRFVGLIEDPPYGALDVGAEHLAQFGEWASRGFRSLQERIYLLERGVDMAQYEKFARLTPQVAFFGAGTLRFVGFNWRAPSSPEDATFASTLLSRPCWRCRAALPRLARYLLAPGQGRTCCRTARCLPSPRAEGRMAKSSAVRPWANCYPSQTKRGGTHVPPAISQCSKTMTSRTS